MTWSNICVEGFCGGDKDDNENYPCGRYSPSHLCLENNMCPLFGYAEVSEREVARFPKLRLIIWDRIGIWVDDIYWRLRWWFWDRFKEMKVYDFTHMPPDEEAEFEAEEEKDKQEFKAWFKELEEK